MTGIIESSPGEKSSTRVMALLVAITGCAVYGWSAYTGQPAPDIPASWLPIIPVLLGAPGLRAIIEAKSQEIKARVEPAKIADIVQNEVQRRFGPSERPTQPTGSK